jgi:hypothetical protein
MEPEDFDMKARKANEETFPPFENEAWDKMELLLDKHLPQKKDKRRFFFWWFAALIPVALITGYFLVIQPATEISVSSKPGNSFDEINNKQSVYPQTKTQKKIPDIIPKKVDVPKTNKTTIEEDNKGTRPINLIEKDDHKTAYNKPSGDNVFKNRLNITTDRYSNKSTLKKGFKSTGSTLFSQQDHISKLRENEIEMNKNIEAQPPSNSLNTNKEKDKPESPETNILLAGKGNNNDVTPASDTATTAKVNNPLKSNNKSVAKTKTSKHNFYLNLTSGLEANGTSPDNLGALKPVYGAGLQYSLAKAFVRAGVVITNKIYVAKDKDYTRKSGTWMSAVTFDNIVAKCKVIEVPLSIGYTVVSNKKTNGYITAGTSAYFMKKEEYQFYFKNGSGNDTTRSANFSNNSNHYFSSLNLSAGIEQTITNKLSLIAEPFVKVPLKGIGFGKVKLYSGGILLTAKLRLK